VGIIHCVGSRDRNYNNYCSVICCMSSLKFAHLVQERTGAQVYNFYIDMRTAYKDYDEFYQRVLEEGTLFVRGRVAEVTDAARLPGEEGKLIIQAEDTLAGKQRRIPVDMVILATGLEPRHDAKEVGQPVRHFLQRRWLVYREAPQAGPGRDHDRGHLHRRCRPGAEGYPQRVAGRGRGRPGAQLHRPAVKSSWNRSGLR
jgi:heterodisulfide reductase subunit A2